MPYTGVRDGKGEKGKKQAKEIISSWFSFTLYTLILCKCIPNLKTLTILGAENSDENFILEKKKKSHQNRWQIPQPNRHF